MFKLILIAVITLGVHSAKAENSSESITTESEATTNLGENRELASEKNESVEAKTTSAEEENYTPAVVPADEPDSSTNSAEGTPEVMAPPAANESSSTTGTVATGEETNTESPELPEMNCSDMFLQWVRQQPVKNQEKFFEAYFLSTDWNTYRKDKEDEFVWREKEALYKKEFKELLAQKPKTYVLRADVALGKYDFKKKGFPVEIKHSKEGVLENMYSGGGYMSFGAMNTPKGGSIYCHGNREEVKFPTQILVGIQKIQGPKFLAVSEAQGKEITASLGASRHVRSIFEVEVVSLVAKPGFLNKKEQYFSINTKLKKATMYIGQEAFEYKF